jgi:hypothetical protein
MEAAGSLETLLNIYQTTPHFITGDSNLDSVIYDCNATCACTAEVCMIMF